MEFDTRTFLRQEPHSRVPNGADGYLTHFNELLAVFIQRITRTEKNVFQVDWIRMKPFAEVSQFYNGTDRV